MFFPQRFRCFIGIFFLLAWEEVETAIQASCTFGTKEWSWNGQSKNLKTCFPIINKVTEKDFTISLPSDRTTPGFYFSDNRNVEFLPTNLREAFPGLTVFAFLACAVTSVDENHFKGLSKLKDLNVGFNRISQVASNAFVDLVILEGLSLGNNRIRFLMKNTFAPLKTLKQLYLDNNEIQSLHPKIFDALENVENLFLHTNDIASLDENIFENVVNLKKMPLNHNKLERIPKDLFKFNSKLELLWLNDNKIKSLRANMFDHILSLKFVNFQHNLCANDFYYADRFDAMRNDLKQNCADYCGVSQQEQGLIVLGQDFVHGSYPWIVALLYTGTTPYTFFCGGTVISKTFVISGKS